MAPRVVRAPDEGRPEQSPPYVINDRVCRQSLESDVEGRRTAAAVRRGRKGKQGQDNGMRAFLRRRGEVGALGVFRLGDGDYLLRYRSQCIAKVTVAAVVTY